MNYTEMLTDFFPELNLSECLHMETLDYNGDPYEIFRTFIDDTSFFLDSSNQENRLSPDENNRYSILGIDPIYKVYQSDSNLFVEKSSYEKGKKGTSSFETLFTIDTNKNTETNINIFTLLNDITQRFHMYTQSDCPFMGGFMGYFNYELSKYMEALPRINASHYELPLASLTLYNQLIIYDYKNKSFIIISLGLRGEASDACHLLIKSINEQIYKSYNKSSFSSPDSYERKTLLTNQKNKHENDAYKSGLLDLSTYFKSDFSRKSYINTIQKMRQYIENGDIYIANMTHTFKGTIKDSPLKIYDRLRKNNPAPFSAYFAEGNHHILSSSPERFIQVKKVASDFVVETKPIKGTVPKGLTKEEDLLNIQRLKTSEKDRSELLMIVDLERNDLNQVCKPGSVKVTEHFAVESFATVHHLVTTIRGVLSEKKTAIDLMAAAFPGGSITGAPKIRAMEIIEELEATSRQLYTGCIGYFDFRGNADFNIVIRTLVTKGSQVYIGVGGGITWESEPEAEYEETLDKAKALFQTILHP